jgi:hypothetical protein
MNWIDRAVAKLKAPLVAQIDTEALVPDSPVTSINLGVTDSAVIFTDEGIIPVSSVGVDDASAQSRYQVGLIGELFRTSNRDLLERLNSRYKHRLGNLN